MFDGTFRDSGYYCMSPAVALAIAANLDKFTNAEAQLRIALGAVAKQSKKRARSDFFIKIR